MPKKPTEFQYRDITIEKISSGKKRKNGYYIAILRYCYLGIPVVKRSVQRKDLDELQNAIVNDVLPEMYWQIAMIRLNSSNNDQKDLTIGLFWEMYKEEIAARNGWNAKSTRDQKEKLAQRVLPILFNKPIEDLSQQDYFSAVEQVIKETNPKNKDVQRDNYLVLLGTITNTALIEGICSEDPLEDYLQERVAKKESTESIIRDRFTPSHLSLSEEHAIVESIIQNIDKECLYLGLAFMLFAGLSADESCALRISDVKKTSFPQLISIHVSKACKTNSKSKAIYDDDVMSTLHKYRVIPAHPMLIKLIDKKIELNKNRRGIEQKDFFLITKGQNTDKRATPEELKALWKSIATELQIKTSYTILAGGGSNPIELSSQAGILRNNFAYRMLENGMTEDETRYLIGQKMNKTASIHYRDWVSDYTQLALFIKMCRWCQEDINPFCFDDAMESSLAAGNRTAIKMLVPTHAVAASLGITMKGAKGNVKIMLKSANGFSVECVKRPPHNNLSLLLQTDKAAYILDNEEKLTPDSEQLK